MNNVWYNNEEYRGQDFNQLIKKIDFEVVKKKLYYDDKPINRYATVRKDTDEYLGIVSDKYKIVQNRDAFRFLENIEMPLQHVAAGHVKDRSFWLVKLEGDFFINAGDGIGKFVLFVNSFNGETKFLVCLTPIRFACSNTLLYAIDKAYTTLSIAHKGNIEKKKAEAITMFSDIVKMYKQIEETFHLFVNTKINMSQIKTYLNAIFDIDVDKKNKILEEILTLYYKETQYINTLWGIYNAVTEYIDHKRFNSNNISYILFGQGATLKIKALKVAKQYLI